MQLQLRQAIIKRIEDKSIEELKDIVEDAIDNEERVLPGLGVMVEMCWRESPPSFKNQFVAILHQTLHKEKNQEA